MAGIKFQQELLKASDGNVVISGSALFKNGKSGFVYVESRVGQDNVSQYWFKTGFRMEF